MPYTVHLREVGAKRHSGLGRDALTTSRMHVLHFDTADDARDAARWMLEHNPGEFDSAQVRDSRTRRPVEGVELEPAR